MKDLNILLIEGNLVRDPELRETDTGLPFCRFSIANHRSYKKSGEWVNDVNFINAVVWGRVAENCTRFLKKGDKVRAKGRIEQDNYVNKEGHKVTTYELSARSVDFLEKPKKREEVSAAEPVEAVAG